MERMLRDRYFALVDVASSRRSRACCYLSSFDGILLENRIERFVACAEV
jgi:hypothetical protein